MGDPLAALGGYDRNAAMMGQSGFAPMNQSAPQKKPGFFSKGGGWVDVLGAFGDAFSENGPVYAQQKAQQNSLMQRQQMAEQQRQQEREDFIWKSQYERDNPKPANPYRFKANDGDIYEIGPDGKQNRLFDDPTPKVNWIQVKDPVSGAISIVPMGPNGRMDAAPQFAGWPDEEGGPASQAPGGFSGW
jgi:hypothetical protein